MKGLPDEATHHVRAIRLGATTLLALLLLMRTAILNLDLRSVCAIVSVLALAAVWTATRATTRGLWSAATAYLLVFVLFHFGLALLAAAGQPPPEYAVEYVSSWFNSYGATREALYLSALACWAFVSAYAWAIPSDRRARPQVVPPPASSQLASPAAGSGSNRNDILLSVASRLGAILVLVGSGLILGYVAITVPSLLLGQGGRSAYWNSVEGSPAQLIGAPLITSGGVLLAIGRPALARTLGLTALALFGSWALVVGARTSIMYTVLTMVVVLARRRPMPSGRVALALFALGLVVVGFVGQARLSGGYSERASLDPRSGLAEMGGSIRPVIEVVQYRRVNHEPLLLGVTYVSFVIRAGEGALGLPRPDGLIDPRIAGNEFRGRLDGYQIGYSAVAEAFRNGDRPGVLIVFGIFGAVFGRLDRRRSPSPNGDYVVGVVFFALAYHIRQPSVSLVANVVLGLVPLLLLGLLAASPKRGGATSVTPVPLTGIQRPPEGDVHGRMAPTP